MSQTTAARWRRRSQTAGKTASSTAWTTSYRPGRARRTKEAVRATSHASFFKEKPIGTSRTSGGAGARSRRRPGWEISSPSW